MELPHLQKISCTICSKDARVYCGGCVNMHPPSYYCGRVCQIADQPSHKTLCQAAQAQTMLFRAGDLLQQSFLQTRAEAFDLCVTRVERFRDGAVHFFDEPAEGVCPLSPAATNGIDKFMKNAVLSYGAARDVFSGLMFELGERAFKGWTAKVEEMDIRMYKSFVSTYHHHANDPSTAVFDTVHHVLRVTLEDNSTWAVDLAGAHFGQHNSVLPFADYDRACIAEVLDTRPFGTNAKHFDVPILARNPGNTTAVDQLKGYLIHLLDELAEWEHHRVPVQKVLRPFWEADQAQLAKYLAMHTREYVKLVQGDPSSIAKLIPDTNDGWEKMSVEEKGRMDRKIDRKVGAMVEEVRKVQEEENRRGRRR